MSVLNIKFEEGLKLIKALEKVIECWKKIEDYENYSVSSFGRVRNDMTKLILKPGTDYAGYYIVNLYQNRKAKTFKIHRLVAIYFIPNPMNKKCVDHIDHDRKNNRINNLRFATVQENNRNASKKKSNTSNYIGVCYCKQNKKYIAQYHLNGKLKYIGYYQTALEASKAYQAKIKVHYKEFANV